MCFISISCMCHIPDVSSTARHRADRTRKMIVLQHLSYNPTQEHEKKKENLNQGSDIREKNTTNSRTETRNRNLSKSEINKTFSDISVFLMYYTILNL